MAHTRRKRRIAWLAVGLLGAATAQSSFASGHDWKLSTSLNYESGTYGTSTRSSSLYVPFTIKRAWDDWHASLTLPYVSLSTDRQVANVGGRPARIRKGPAGTARDTQSGPGDAVLRGGYALFREDAHRVDLTVIGKIKAPTADKDKGLGTGEFDEGLGLEFAKLVMADWTLIADLAYTVIGDPSTTDLNNQTAVDIGFSHALQKDLTLTVLFEGSNALVSGEPHPMDLRGIFDYKLSERGALFGGGLIGLTDGSPDLGFTLGGRYRF